MLPAKHRWKYLAALTVVLPLQSCDWFQPFEHLCEQRLAATSIDIEAAPINVDTDFTKSSAELTAMGAASTGRQVLGLTQTNLKWAVSFSGNGITRRTSGRHCMRPAIKVRLAFEPMTVLVGSEQRENSCAFNITMDHERKHVAIYERFLADISARVETELRERFGNQIYYFGSEAEAERHVQSITRDYLAPIVDKSMQQVNARQAVIDTPEEYFRLETFQNSCGS